MTICTKPVKIKIKGYLYKNHMSKTHSRARVFLKEGGRQKTKERELPLETIFHPSVWEEDILPENEKAYAECEVCTPKSRIIWGEGAKNAPCMIILDNPGEREDRDGKKYVCGTRQTLQKTLYETEISPENVYLTYLLKCRPLKKYDKQKARAFSLPFLERQIERQNPLILAVLGDVAAQALTRDENQSVKALRGAWIPLLGRQARVSYHPLAVRRRPNLLPLFYEDFQAISAALKKLRP